MPLPPGGLIPSGIGGRVYGGTLGTDLTQALTGAPPFPANVMMTDVGGWRLQALAIAAECTHSGTYGAITRRVVAYDWTATLGIPYDYKNPPELIFNAPQSVGVRLNLGDVTQDPLLSQQAGIKQQFYVAPSGLLTAVRPVLDGAGRDVVRIDLVIAGSSLILRLPDQQQEYTDYIAYLVSRGWLV